MGDVIKLHARASAGSAAAKASKLTSGRPFSAAKRTKEGHRCAGMPLVRQVLTVLAGTPKASETAPVPPSASIAELGVSADMAANIVRRLRTCQAFANCEATNEGAAASIGVMADALTRQSQRLKALREACGNESQQEFGARFSPSKGHWSDFENGKRPLTLDMARKIKARYRLPLDWLLDGDIQALELAPAHLARKLAQSVA